MLREEEPSSPASAATTTATSSTKKKTAAAVQWQKEEKTATAAAEEEEGDVGLEDSSSSLLPIAEEANEGEAAGIGEVMLQRENSRTSSIKSPTTTPAAAAALDTIRARAKTKIASKVRVKRGMKPLVALVKEVQLLQATTNETLWR